MHALYLWADGAKTRKTRATKYSQSPGQQRRGAPRSSAPPAFDRTQFCRRCEQSSLQTRPLAATLAAANPRLADRSNSEHAHPPSPSKSKRSAAMAVVVSVTFTEGVLHTLHRCTYWLKTRSVIPMRPPLPITA